MTVQELEIEKNEDLHRAEIREASITEYRENQIMRIVQCTVIAPLCIYTGIKYRKQLPMWLRIGLITAGAATFIYHGRNFYKNFKQDGKIIRESIKQKKEAEKKVREELKKNSAEENESGENNEHNKDNSETIKQEIIEKLDYTLNGNGSDKQKSSKTESANIQTDVDEKIETIEPVIFLRRKGERNVVIPEANIFESEKNKFLGNGAENPVV